MANFVLSVGNGISATINQFPSDPIVGENVVFWLSDFTGLNGADPYEVLRPRWGFDDTGATHDFGGGGIDDDANEDMGFVVVKTWDTNGTKNITCDLIRKDQDVFATLTKAVTVQAVSAVTWEEEWYVSFAGDFAEAPAASGSIIHVSSYADLISRMNATSASPVNYKVLFNRGETYPWADRMNGFRYSYIVYWGAFGTGADPIFTPDSGNTRTDDARLLGNVWGDGTLGKRVILNDIEVQGGYDPVTGDAPNGYLSACYLADSTTAGAIMAMGMHKCKMSGSGSAVSNGGNRGTEVFLTGTNSIITDWQDYGIASFGGVCTFAFTGTQMLQNPLAIRRDGRTGVLPQAADHGPFRVAQTKRFCFNKCKAASLTGWSPAFGAYFTQPIGRIYTEFFTTDGSVEPYTYDTVIGQAYGNVGFGNQFISTGNSTPSADNPTLRHAPFRLVFDANDYTVTEQGGEVFDLQLPGAYITNNVVYFADVREFAGPPVLAHSRLLTGEFPVTPDLLNGPVHIENNTIVLDCEQDVDNSLDAFYVWDNAEWQTDPANQNYGFDQIVATERSNLVRATYQANAGDFTDYGTLDPTNRFRVVTGQAGDGAVSGVTWPVYDIDGVRRTGSTTNVGAHATTSSSAGTVNAPVNTVAPTIAQLEHFPGELHVSDFGTWTNWTGDDEYVVERRWKVGGVVQAKTPTLEFFDNDYTGSILCTVTATNRSGTRVSQDSNTITVEEIVSNDFTTDSTTESVSITPSDGSKWTNENINGASSTRGYTTHESQQVYSFFVDGADGETAPPEKASIVDDFTFGTGGYTAPSAMTYGDTLIVEFEIKVDGNGWTVFDFEQKTMTHSGGTLTNQGVRIALDDSGSWVVIRSELSSGYSTWTQIGGTTAFPFNEWVTVRVVALIDDDSNGRVRIWQNDELVLDNNGSVMFNAADILASDGITITGTPQVDVLEFGLSALYDSITGSRTMYARNFKSRIIRA